VVQGQIGGESRPGSPSEANEGLSRQASLWSSFESGTFCVKQAGRRREQPSGRLLELQCELQPRGMIVGTPTCRSSTESGLQAHPPYYLFADFN
jgi:hypothetical protein